jgi:hypothetical protein
MLILLPSMTILKKWPVFLITLQLAQYPVRKLSITLED